MLRPPPGPPLDSGGAWANISRPGSSAYGFQAAPAALGDRGAASASAPVLAGEEPGDSAEGEALSAEDALIRLPPSVRQLRQDWGRAVTGWLGALDEEEQRAAHSASNAPNDTSGSAHGGTNAPSGGMGVPESEDTWSSFSSGLAEGESDKEAEKRSEGQEDESSDSDFSPSKESCNFCDRSFGALDVRFQCHICKDFCLCLDCYLAGVEYKSHRPDHLMYPRVRFGFLSWPDGWTMDDELSFLEAVECCGFGSWDAILRYMGRSPPETLSPCAQEALYRTLLSHWISLYARPPEAEQKLGRTFEREQGCPSPATKSLRQSADGPSTKGSPSAPWPPIPDADAVLRAPSVFTPPTSLKGYRSMEGGIWAGIEPAPQLWLRGAAARLQGERLRNTGLSASRQLAYPNLRRKAAASRPKPPSGIRQYGAIAACTVDPEAFKLLPSIRSLNVYVPVEELGGLLEDPAFRSLPPAKLRALRARARDPTFSFAVHSNPLDRIIEVDLLLQDAVSGLRVSRDGGTPSIIGSRAALLLKSFGYGPEDYAKIIAYYTEWVAANGPPPPPHRGRGRLPANKNYHAKLEFPTKRFYDTVAAPDPFLAPHGMEGFVPLHALLQPCKTPAASAVLQVKEEEDFLPRVLSEVPQLRLFLGEDANLDASCFAQTDFYALFVGHDQPAEEAAVAKPEPQIQSPPADTVSQRAIVPANARRNLYPVSGRELYGLMFFREHLNALYKGSSLYLSGLVDATSFPTGKPIRDLPASAGEGDGVKYILGSWPHRRDFTYEYSNKAEYPLMYMKLVFQIPRPLEVKHYSICLSGLGPRDQLAEMAMQTHLWLPRPDGAKGASAPTFALVGRSVTAQDLSAMYVEVARERAARALAVSKKGPVAQAGGVQETGSGGDVERKEGAEQAEQTEQAKPAEQAEQAKQTEQAEQTERSASPEQAEQAERAELLRIRAVARYNHLSLSAIWAQELAYRRLQESQPLFNAFKANGLRFLAVLASLWRDKRFAEYTPEGSVVYRTYGEAWEIPARRKKAAARGAERASLRSIPTSATTSPEASQLESQSSGEVDESQAETSGNSKDSGTGSSSDPASEEGEPAAAEAIAGDSGSASTSLVSPESFAEKIEDMGDSLLFAKRFIWSRPRYARWRAKMSMVSVTGWGDGSSFREDRTWSFPHLDYFLRPEEERIWGEKVDAAVKRGIVAQRKFLFPKQVCEPAGDSPEPHERRDRRGRASSRRSLERVRHTSHKHHRHHKHHGAHESHESHRVHGRREDHASHRRRGASISRDDPSPPTKRVTILDDRSERGRRDRPDKRGRRVARDDVVEKEEERRRRKRGEWEEEERAAKKRRASKRSAELGASKHRDGRGEREGHRAGHGSSHAASRLSRSKRQPVPSAQQERSTHPMESGGVRFFAQQFSLSAFVDYSFSPALWRKAHETPELAAQQAYSLLEAERLQTLPVEDHRASGNDGRTTERASRRGTAACGSRENDSAKPTKASKPAKLAKSAKPAKSTRPAKQAKKAGSRGSRTSKISPESPALTNSGVTEQSEQQERSSSGEAARQPDTGVSAVAVIADAPLAPGELRLQRHSCSYLQILRNYQEVSAILQRGRQLPADPFLQPLPPPEYLWLALPKADPPPDSPAPRDFGEFISYYQALAPREDLFCSAVSAELEHFASQAPSASTQPRIMEEAPDTPESLAFKLRVIQAVTARIYERVRRKQRIFQQGIHLVNGGVDDVVRSIDRDIMLHEGRDVAVLYSDDAYTLPGLDSDDILKLEVQTRWISRAFTTRADFRGFLRRNLEEHALRLYIYRLQVARMLGVPFPAASSVIDEFLQFPYQYEARFAQPGFRDRFPPGLINFSSSPPRYPDRVASPSTAHLWGRATPPLVRPLAHRSGAGKSESVALTGGAAEPGERDVSGAAGQATGLAREGLGEVQAKLEEGPKEPRGVGETGEAGRMAAAKAVRETNQPSTSACFFSRPGSHDAAGAGGRGRRARKGIGHSGGPRRLSGLAASWPCRGCRECGCGESFCMSSYIKSFFSESMQRLGRALRYCGDKYALTGGHFREDDRQQDLFEAEWSSLLVEPNGALGDLLFETREGQRQCTSEVFSTSPVPRKMRILSGHLRRLEELSRSTHVASVPLSGLKRESAPAVPFSPVSLLPRVSQHREAGVKAEVVKPRGAPQSSRRPENSLPLSRLTRRPGQRRASFLFDVPMQYRSLFMSPNYGITIPLTGPMNLWSDGIIYPALVLIRQFFSMFPFSQTTALFLGANDGCGSFDLVLGVVASVALYVLGLLMFREIFDSALCVQNSELAGARLSRSLNARMKDDYVASLLSPKRGDRVQLKEMQIGVLSELLGEPFKPATLFTFAYYPQLVSEFLNKQFVGPFWKEVCRAGPIISLARQVHEIALGGVSQLGPLASLEGTARRPESMIYLEMDRAVQGKNSAGAGKYAGTSVWQPFTAKFLTDLMNFGALPIHRSSIFHSSSSVEGFLTNHGAGSSSFAIEMAARSLNSPQKVMSLVKDLCVRVPRGMQSPLHSTDASEVVARMDRIQATHHRCPEVWRTGLYGNEVVKSQFRIQNTALGRIFEGSDVDSARGRDPMLRKLRDMEFKPFPLLPPDSYSTMAVLSVLERYFSMGCNEGFSFVSLEYEFMLAAHIFLSAQQYGQRHVLNVGSEFAGDSAVSGQSYAQGSLRSQSRPAPSSDAFLAAPPYFDLDRPMFDYFDRAVEDGRHYVRQTFGPELPNHFKGFIPASLLYPKFGSWPLRSSIQSSAVFTTAMAVFRGIGSGAGTGSVIRTMLPHIFPLFPQTSPYLHIMHRHLRYFSPTSETGTSILPVSASHEERRAGRSPFLYPGGDPDAASRLYSPRVLMSILPVASSLFCSTTPPDVAAIPLLEALKMQEAGGTPAAPEPEGDASVLPTPLPSSASTTQYPQRQKHLKHDPLPIIANSSVLRRQFGILVFGNQETIREGEIAVPTALFSAAQQAYLRAFRWELSSGMSEPASLFPRIVLSARESLDLIMDRLPSLSAPSANLARDAKLAAAVQQQGFLEALNLQQRQTLQQTLLASGYGVTVRLMTPESFARVMSACTAILEAGRPVLTLFFEGCQHSGRANVSATVLAVLQTVVAGKALDDVSKRMGELLPLGALALPQKDVGSNLFSETLIQASTVPQLRDSSDIADKALGTPFFSFFGPPIKHGLRFSYGSLRTLSMLHSGPPRFTKASRLHKAVTKGKSTRHAAFIPRGLYKLPPLTPEVEGAMMAGLTLGDILLAVLADVPIPALLQAKREIIVQGFTLTEATVDVFHGYPGAAEVFLLLIQAQTLRGGSRAGLPDSFSGVFQRARGPVATLDNPVEWRPGEGALEWCPSTVQAYAQVPLLADWSAFTASDMLRQPPGPVPATATTCAVMEVGGWAGSPFSLAGQGQSDALYVTMSSRASRGNSVLFKYDGRILGMFPGGDACPPPFLPRLANPDVYAVPAAFLAEVGSLAAAQDVELIRLCLLEALNKSQTLQDLGAVFSSVQEPREGKNADAASSGAGGNVGSSVAPSKDRPSSSFSAPAVPCLLTKDPADVLRCRLVSGSAMEGDLLEAIFSIVIDQFQNKRSTSTHPDTNAHQPSTQREPIPAGVARSASRPEHPASVPAPVPTAPHAFPASQSGYAHAVSQTEMQSRPSVKQGAQPPAPPSPAMAAYPMQGMYSQSTEGVQVSSSLQTRQGIQNDQSVQSPHILQGAQAFQTPMNVAGAVNAMQTMTTQHHQGAQMHSSFQPSLSPASSASFGVLAFPNTHQGPQQGPAMLQGYPAQPISFQPHLNQIVQPAQPALRSQYSYYQQLPYPPQSLPVPAPAGQISDSQYFVQRPQGALPLMPGQVPAQDWVAQTSPEVLAQQEEQRRLRLRQQYMQGSVAPGAFPQPFHQAAPYPQPQLLPGTAPGQISLVSQVGVAAANPVVTPPVEGQAGALTAPSMDSRVAASGPLMAPLPGPSALSGVPSGAAGTPGMHPGQLGVQLPVLPGGTQGAPAFPARQPPGPGYPSQANSPYALGNLVQQAPAPPKRPEQRPDARPPQNHPAHSGAQVSKPAAPPSGQKPSRGSALSRNMLGRGRASESHAAQK